MRDCIIEKKSVILEWIQELGKGAYMFNLPAVKMFGCEMLPLIEGGKGISVSDGRSAGAWAYAGGVGTFSGVNAASYDEKGRRVPMVFWGRTRSDRHRELIAYAIKGGIEQALIAHEQSSGRGRVQMNVLWEMAAVEEVLEGILSKASFAIHGITCGAGMPYNLAAIAARFKKFYSPIVSSARAFRALWKRSYYKVADWLGTVVYEDPWRAGGHNGLSNVEDPLQPQAPYERVRSLRETMRDVGLGHIPITIAGGVWFLREWSDWIGNPELGPIAFQFGTRPLLTRESPISDAWKQELLAVKQGEVLLNRFSPTGFYSSAVNNPFLMELGERSKRQILFSRTIDSECSVPFPFGERGEVLFVRPYDKGRAEQWITEGFTFMMKTPDSTLIFVTPNKASEIRSDQEGCMGCLSACSFSGWCQRTGALDRLPDPRSFCIQKTLQSIGHGGDPKHELMFAGHQIYRFSEDPFYANGIPTVQQLVERIATGD